MELALAQPPPPVEDNDEEEKEKSHEMVDMEEVQNLQSEEERITQAEKDKRLQQQLLVSLVRIINDTRGRI